MSMPLIILNEVTDSEFKINCVVILSFQQIQQVPIFYPIILPVRNICAITNRPD